MDKINLAKWNEIFGRTEQELVFRSDRYTDMRIRFEEPGLASGWLQSVSVPGMHLTELNVQAADSFCLVDEEGREAVESVFVLEGQAESRFPAFESPLLFGKKQQNLQYNRHFAGEHQVSSHFHALTINYELSFLEDLFRGGADSRWESLAESMEKKTPYLATKKALFWEASTSAAITAIRECRFSGAMRYLFLESKMVELFVWQMEYADAIGKCKHRDEYSVTERGKLHAVREFIESSYLQDFSLKDLTYRFGLNEFKLKSGYKQIFGTTVFGNVHALRMEKARQMIQQQEMNVTEAAYFIGYLNVSSFCTEFRKRFGQSPGQVKRA